MRIRLPLALIASLALLGTDLRAGAQEEPSPGDAAMALGQEAARSGQFSDAAEAWHAAAEAYAREGRTLRRVDAWMRLAEAQQALGHYADAVSTLAQAQSLAASSGDAARQAAALGALGNALVASRDPESARRYLEQGLSLAREAEADALAAAIQNNLGNLHAAQGRRREARTAYAEAGQRARAAGRTSLAARAEANAARVLLDAGGAASEARSHLAAARRAAGTLPSGHGRVSIRVNLGSSYVRLVEAGGHSADVRAAHELLEAARKEAEQLGDVRTLSYALGHMGRLYALRGRRDDALALTRRATFRAQEAGAPESLYRWQWQTGRLLAERGELEGALEAYAQAVTVLGEIRHEMASGYASGGTSFRERVGPVFFEMVDLLLRTAPDPSQAAAYQARLLRARDTIEDLKAAELRDYFQDECVDAARAKVQSLDAAAGSALVVYPIPLADRLELLLSRADGLSRVTVPVDAATLTAEVRRLRRLLEKRTTREYLPHAQRLYDWLVRPLETQLARDDVTALVFVPDGPLRTIPMAALHDGRRFLVERVPLAITPGLALTDPRPLDREALRLFLSGLSEPVQGFPPLEHVPAELDAIRALYGGELLLDADFSIDRVEDTLTERDFNVVHIASHGVFAGDAEDSFLLTYDGRLTMDRLSDYVGRFRFRETPLELLTLSACETAEGDDRAALGLAGVAVKAGARSALGTLWSVNDAAAAALISAFYGELRDPTVSRAEALRRAQRRLHAEPDTRHPFYWSPFLLISNWL